MFEPDPNDALSQNFTKLGLLMAHGHTDRQTVKRTRFMFYKYRLGSQYALIQEYCLDYDLNYISKNMHFYYTTYISKH